MIRTRFLPSFDEAFRALDAVRRRKTAHAVERLIEYFDGGPRPRGLGLRKLRGDFWEVRVGLDLRVLFLLEGSAATFIVVGSHDEIRRRIRR